MMAGEPVDAGVSPEPGGPAQLPVRIELGEGRTEEVIIASVNHLFVDIEHYNRQFSMGSIMARGLISLFEHDDEVQPGETIRQENENQGVTASALSAIHQATLNKIGLSLEPVAGGATLMAIGAEATSGQMRLNVRDGRRFVSFLHALQPQQIEETGLKLNLESLSEILTLQALRGNLTEPTDESLQLIGSMGNIVGEYRRLGMGEAVERLDTYSQHARAGDLREFVAIESSGYLWEPGQYFGPADWERDTTPEMLGEKWDGALNILIMARDNPKAQVLYQQLKNHLAKCAAIARQVVQSQEVNEYYTAERRSEMDGVLEEAEKRLQSITAEQNPT